MHEYICTFIYVRICPPELIFDNYTGVLFFYSHLPIGYFSKHCLHDVPWDFNSSI